MARGSAVYGLVQLTISVSRLAGLCLVTSRYAKCVPVCFAVAADCDHAEGGLMADKQARLQCSKQRFMSVQEPHTSTSYFGFPFQVYSCMLVSSEEDVPSGQ